MSQIDFVKMDGLGNDFVVIDSRHKQAGLTPEEVIAIGNRKTGVGFDQLIVIEPSTKAFARMQIYNSDGSFAGACGNGARCVADLLMQETKKQALDLEAPDGTILKAFREKPESFVTVNMGRPKLDWSEIPLLSAQDTLAIEGVSDVLPCPVGVSMGNPHAVFFVENVEQFDVAKYGSFVETHPLFPKKINVEFVEVIASDVLRMRVWERGAGITLACGTGACATLIAAVRRGLIPSTKAQVHMDGGSLTIEWQDKQDILMTGPTHLSFMGSIIRPNL